MSSCLPNIFSIFTIMTVFFAETILFSCQFPGFCEFFRCPGGVCRAGGGQRHPFPVPKGLRRFIDQIGSAVSADELLHSPVIP